MTNRSAESTIDRIIHIIENPSNVFGDLRDIGNLVLNAKSQLKIEKIEEPPKCKD